MEGQIDFQILSYIAYIVIIVICVFVAIRLSSIPTKRHKFASAGLALFAASYFLALVFAYVGFQSSLSQAILEIVRFTGIVSIILAAAGVIK